MSVKVASRWLLISIILSGIHTDIVRGYTPETTAPGRGGHDDVITNEVSDESRSCPIAFTDIGGRCYFFGYFKLNWFRAMEFCHSFGQSVSLACIETDQENQALKRWLLLNGDHSTGVWVGGSDNGHVGKWAWFPTGQLIKKFNWGPSQPTGDDQHCMYIVGGYLGYQWADFHCGFEMTFLCEHDVNGGNEAWRRRREMKKARDNTAEDDAEMRSIETRIFEAMALSRNDSLDDNDDHRGSLNSKFQLENFSQNEVISPWEHAAIKKSVKVTTRKPFKNSVIISTQRTNKYKNKLVITPRIKQKPKISNSRKITTTTTSRPTTTAARVIPAAAAAAQLTDSWSIFNFIKRVIQLG